MHKELEEDVMSYLIAFFVSVMVGAFVVGGVALNSDAGILAAWLFITLTILGPTATGCVQLGFELRKHRKAYEFLRYHMMILGSVSEEAHNQLTASAVRVREAAERQLLLQDLGHPTFLKQYGDEVINAHEETYEQTVKRLKGNFDNRRTCFYLLYDQVASVNELLLISLRKRDWKQYAGAPELPKQSAS